MSIKMAWTHFCVRRPLCHMKFEQNLTCNKISFKGVRNQSLFYHEWIKKASNGVLLVNEHSHMDTHFHLHTAQKQFVIWQVCIFKYLYIIYTEGGLVWFWGQLVRSSSSPLDLSHSKKSFTFIFTTPFPIMSSGDPSWRSHSKKLSSEIMSSS